MQSLSALIGRLLLLLLALTGLSGVVHADVFLTTGFEGSSGLPSGWTQSTISGTGSWTIASGGAGSIPTSAHQGTNNARLFVGSYSDNTTRLISPTFNTVGFINLTLNFWHTQGAWYGTYQDDLKVLYSSDGGSTWTQLVHYTNNILDWTQRSLVIPTSGANMRIAFEGNAKWGHGICLDDIQVTAIPNSFSEVFLSATDASASELGPDPGTWTITRTGNTTGPLSVNYTLSGTATVGSDYTLNASSPITFAAGETSKVVTLTPVDDTVGGEGDEIATLALTEGSGYAINTASGSISIYDDEGFGLNVLVIGSTHSFSEDGESSAVKEAAFNPTTIATNLKNLLLADPANTDTINVAFEDIYRTSLQPVISGGNSNTVYTEANATWMTFECHTLAQYFMWPDGKAVRMANLRGQSGTKWDYIVIVEDPYVLANFPGMYAEATKLFHEEISKGTGELVLMSQWPKVGSTFTATAFNEHAFRVGKSLDVRVAPAAKAWNDLTTKDTSANHPTPNGAYLAATSLYSTLTNRNATSFVTGATNQSLAQLAYNTVQTTNSTAQYSGIYSETNKFQMQYNRKRLLIGSQQGTSTERGIWYEGILPAALASGVSFTIPGATITNVFPVDFNLGRGYLGTDKYYIVDPTKYSRSYGFPTGDNSQTKGAETMRYGIDKRNASGSYDQNTDLGIAYNMLRQGEVDPSSNVRAIPMRLLWSKLYHYDPTAPAYQDLWHLSSQLNRAAGGFLFTLNSGRCPIGDEPTPQGSAAWQQWLGLKIGYETAWQMSHMTSRVPGFRVIPTTNKPETGYVVTPYFSQGLSVKFIYPPKSNVTVNVSVSDPAAGTVNTNSLTFTPQNYNVPQIISVTGVNRENGEFPFNVILTTSSLDVVYDGHRDEWDYKNNVVASTGSVLIGGWEGAKPYTPDQAITSDVMPSRTSNAPLQSPTLEDKVAAVLTVNNGASLVASPNINHPLNQRYLWGSANLDVKPTDISNTIVYRASTPYVLNLTVNNTHPTKDLRLDTIHWIISRTTTAPTQVSVGYASGNLSDSPGASTVVTLTTGSQHNVNLSTLLTDRVLSSGESATFTWTPDASQFTGTNPTLSVDNFAISGNLLSSAPDNNAPTPNPMSWASVPTAVNSSSITMTATTASDPSGVEYYFDETSGNPGGTDSGWQDSPSYTDTGLNPSTQYTYAVTARDKAVAMNTTVASAPTSATTPTLNPVSASTSTVAASPTAVPADGATTSTITVTLKNAAGAAVSGKTVSLVGNSSATIQTSNNTSDASGVATFTVKSTTVGSEIFTATGDSTTITQTASVNFLTVTAISGLLAGFDGEQTYGAVSPATINSTTGVRQLTEPRQDPGMASAVSARIWTDQTTDKQLQWAVQNISTTTGNWGLSNFPTDASTASAAWVATQVAASWINFEITNTGSLDITLDKFHLSANRTNVTTTPAPNTLTISLVQNGTFANPPVLSASALTASGTQTIALASTTGWNHYEFSLSSMLTNLTLAAGEKATFRIANNAGTGRLYLDNIAISGTVGGSGGGPVIDYDTWRGSYPGLGALNADDDGDGLSNDAERIFGLNPQNPSSANPYAVPLNRATGTLSYTRRRQSLTGLTYKIWYSTDLVNRYWESGAIQTPRAPVGDVEIVDVTLDPSLLSQPKLFIQISAEDLSSPP